MKRATILAVWTVSSTSAALVYKFPIILTLKFKKETAKGHVWTGVYVYSAPSDVIRSTEGDRPIQFTDRGPYSFNFGQFEEIKKTAPQVESE